MKEGKGPNWHHISFKATSVTQHITLKLTSQPSELGYMTTARSHDHKVSYNGIKCSLLTGAGSGKLKRGNMLLRRK